MAAASAAAAMSSPPPLPPPSLAIPTTSRPLLHLSSRRCIPISSRLYSSRSNGSLNNNHHHHHQREEEEEHDDILHQSLPSASSSSINNNFVPVFVTLPKDAVDLNGNLKRRKTLAASFAALSAAGVAGISVELWWGIVERVAPGVYDWGGYLDLFALAGRCGLKVRAILAFHSDPLWIPLPWWVLEEMEKEPDLCYSDRHGKRNKEYISLGCDTLPVLKGRSPIQAYSDFMRSFRDAFRDFLGVIVTEIQVGMGPDGELKYPATLSNKLKQPDNSPEHGMFQCYDKYMSASLSASARKVGMGLWCNGGPEETSFFSNNNSWDTPYGRFFLEWYSAMLLLHGQRLCSVTEAIFLHTGIKISAKVAGIHWQHYTWANPLEFTAGYYNTITRNSYFSITQMLSRYHMTLCCTCFEMQDAEGYLRELVNAARLCNIPILGENSVTRLDDTSLKQVIKSSRLYYSGGAQKLMLSFNYVRMGKSLFEAQNWNRFTRFVRQMSDVRTFHAKLYCRRESCSSLTSTPEELRRAFTCHH